MTTVEVRIELGHHAKLRREPTPDGHTHDWVVFVKGPKGVNLEHFVEKVTFWLHESFDQAKRMLKHPPYKVEESGFAGFNMLIDVHFRNHEEPKMVRFKYDLFLHRASPPVNHTRLEKLTFTNPTEDFRKKLLSGGAQLVMPIKDSLKERSHHSMSPSSKKDRSKSKDHSKRREGSSGHHGDERKKAMNVISAKKDSRVPAKDMKQYEDEFKHPKPLESSKSHKDSNRGEQERGRSEKRKSVSHHDSTAKKKRRSSPALQPTAESRPKSLNVPSGSSQNPLVKKDKVRKIKEKPEVMAGLFAPENSINMTQIKQSKEKLKAESSEGKIKRDKKSSGSTPQSSDSPRNDDCKSTQPSKTSQPGNLTLKIKKERIAGSADKDKKKESSHRHDKVKSEKKKDSSDKVKKRPKENPDFVKVKEREKEVSRKSHVISSASSVGSDMDISSDCNDSPVMSKPSPMTYHEPPPKPDKKPHKVSMPKHSPMRNEKHEKKKSSATEKVKIDKNRPFKESLNVSRMKEKEKVTDSSRSEKSLHTSKPSGGKDKANVSDIKGKSIISHKSKKDKHQSKEAGEKLSKEMKIKPKTTVKPDKPSSNYSSVKAESYSSPLRGVGVSSGMKIKSKKSVKAPSHDSKVKPSQKQLTVNKKSLKSPGNERKTSEIPVARVADKVKAVKSRSHISDTSSDSDSHHDTPQNTKVQSPRKEEIPSQISHLRKDSVSSQSSSVSSTFSSSTDKGPSPSATSSSESSDEEDISDIHTVTEPALSPIQDPSCYSKSINEDMIMSDDSSIASSPMHGDPEHVQENDENMQQPHQSPEKLPSPHFHDMANSQSYSSSDEEFDIPEKPFKNHTEDHVGRTDYNENEMDDNGPGVIIESGSDGSYPHLTESTYRELQDLQKKISYVTDVNRLQKIAQIVEKSHKLLRDDGYFNFDLCSLDKKTIRKIEKELKAV